MKRQREKVLSKIELAYYKRPKKGDEPAKSGITCGWCFEPDITSVGGGYKDEKGRMFHICEQCAVYRYKEDYGYKTLTAARARRRRTFDVAYLFNELLIDIYMNLHDIPDFKYFSDADDLFIKGSELYNILFSKQDKIELEETQDQDTIERQLQNRLSSVNLSKFFSRI